MKSNKTKSPIIVHVLRNRAITICGIEYHHLGENERWATDDQWGRIKHPDRCWECAAIMAAKPDAGK
jgi:hypothetical protein